MPFNPDRTAATAAWKAISSASTLIYRSHCFFFFSFFCVRVCCCFFLFMGQLTAVTSCFVTKKPGHQFPSTKSRDRMELFKMDMWDCGFEVWARHVNSQLLLLSGKLTYLTDWNKSHKKQTFYLTFKIPLRISFSRMTWPRWAAAKIANTLTIYTDKPQTKYN